jgi:uncharacterized protein (DUF1330 family)
VRCYAFAELDVTDPTWVRDYIANVTPLVERHGGRYLARTSQVQQLEGQRVPLPGFLLIEWPSREAADAFYESDEYRPHRDRRQAGARNEFFLFAGEDFSGAARIAE